MSQTIQLDLALVLPSISACDNCANRVLQVLETRRGIERAHVVEKDNHAELCLHFDPTQLSLAQVQRLATEIGAEFNERYRHEQIPFAGLDTADSADAISQALQALPGVLHANLNYAAGVAFIAYDTTQIQRSTIEQTMSRLGATILPPTTLRPATRVPERKQEHDHEQEHEHSHDHAHDGHDHGSAPAFLPHWAQERWTMLLVATAGILLLIGWVGATFFGLPEQVAIIFYILASIAGGYDVATHAVPGLLKGKFDTDVLMLAAAVGAAILGNWLEGAFLLFLFALGHAGEHYALDKARNAVNALGELMPRKARVRRGDQIVEVPVEETRVGDLVVVRPGDRIPVDGQVAKGSGAVDQSPITGESAPVLKVPGDEVFAGTINSDAALDVQVTKLTKDTTLSRIMQLVTEAQSQQSPTQLTTQRFTRWFVPAVLISAVLLTVLPPLFGWMSLNDSFYRAMLLLVAASPCALAIGTPAAVLAGIAQAARNGVLIKGGAYLEQMGRIQAMAFDKTGTITTGLFRVTDVLPRAGVSEDELLEIAAAVESQSSHPLAQAVVREAKQRQLVLPAIEELTNLPGLGVRSVIAGNEVLVGSEKLIADQITMDWSDTEQTIETLENDGRSTIVIALDGQFLGILGLSDTPRTESAAVLQQLQKLGVRHLVMLTGDNQQAAQRIASEVGMTDVRAELLPAEKLAAITELQQSYGPVAMTGDGVNDAPALATATVGIAMGGAGTAVALETADVALMGDDLNKLPFAIGLSRSSRSIIVQNLAISLGVIFLLMIASIWGLVPLSLAVFFHEGSTLVVVANALRLLMYRAA